MRAALNKLKSLTPDGGISSGFQIIRLSSHCTNYPDKWTSTRLQNDLITSVIVLFKIEITIA